MDRGEPPRVKEQKLNIKPILTIEFVSLEELIAFTQRFKDEPWWSRVKREKLNE